MKVDRRIREFLNTRVTLRRDLVITARNDSGEKWYSVEDPVRGKFYRIGPREHEMMRLLNGHRTLGEVLQQLATKTPLLAVAEVEAETICRWLHSKQLVESKQPINSEGESRPLPDRAPAIRNPLLFKIPLLNPDRILAFAERYVGWLFGPLGFSLWLAIVATAALLIVTRLGDLQNGAGGVLARDNWLWLAITWCVLKVCHEFAHGVVCRRYGGPVNEAGLMFIVLAPLAYIDLTSAWRFSSKWQRIHAAIAGIYAEVCIASVAAIVWCTTSVGIVNQLSFNIMLMAGVATLLFNANPLMRFDGYYVLTDLVGVPNLYGQSASWWRSVVARFFWGTPVNTRLTRPVLQRVYGVLAMLWRVFVTTSMLLAASVLFDGLGVILAVFGLIAFVAPTLFRLTQTLVSDRPGFQLSRVRFTLATSGAVAIAVSLFVAVPWAGSQSAPAIVEDSELIHVRSSGPGFVQDVFCRPGDQVQKGEVLLVIENDEFETLVDDLRLQLKKSELIAREHQIAQRRAEYQAELQNIAALRNQLEERIEQRNGLTVVAPRDGVVMGRQLDALPGRFVSTGEELLQVGPPKSDELQVSIAQEDVERFHGWQGKRVSVWLASGSRVQGVLGKVEPNAEATTNHSALLAPYGGTLSVVERRRSIDEESREPAYSLLSPRLSATVRCTGADHGYLGQRAEIRFRPLDESFGGHIVRAARGWLRKRLKDLT